MTDIEQGFERTEKIKVHTSSFLLFMRIIVAVILINILALITTIIFDFSVSFFIARTIIEIVIIIFLYIFWYSNYYRITPSKVIHKTGIVFTNQDSFNIETIDNISCSQSLFGRLCNYWNVTLHFSAKEYVLRCIPNPNYFSSLITRFNKDSQK